LFQQQQRATHRRPRYSIASDEIGLARQRAGRLVFTVSQRLGQDAIELQIAGDARVRGAGKDASTTRVHAWNMLELGCWSGYALFPMTSTQATKRANQAPAHF